MANERKQYLAQSMAKVGSTDWFSGGFGCSTTEIAYIFELEGHTYGGMYEKPFIPPVSAKRFASQFPAGSKLVVRLKPIEIGVSLVRDIDQTAGSAVSPE